MLHLSVCKQKWKIETNCYSSIKHNHIFLLAMTTRVGLQRPSLHHHYKNFEIKCNMVPIMLLYGILYDLERSNSTKLYKTI